MVDAGRMAIISGRVDGTVCSASAAGRWQRGMVPGDRMRRAAGSAIMMPKEQIVDGLTVTLTVVTSRAEAELIAGLLRSNGVRAAVSADDAAGLDPQLQLEGVRILVAPSDEAAARRILAAAGAAGP